ncbi:MAG: hypothetical protein LBE60_05430 [Microbacterium sp.]|jgi:hypothetical protein|uniref:hypothetical protein n=1 Tax=Microbacterium sp. TaxID=51671 RepID=UPI002834C4C4|nr:hypothetical protein [Microbacterium sp.]MDR2321071.1 hypothetical protein [Microbacterium sp.]
MAETEHQRNIRKSREAAEEVARETARAADWQRENALQQARATAAAEAAAQAQRAATDLQATALEDQRRAAFAMWRQTPDGQAFDAWSTQALALIDDYDRKVAEFEAAWESAKQDAADSISQEEREHFTSGVYVEGRPHPTSHVDGSLHFLGTTLVVVCIIVFAVMGVTALFNAGTPAFGVVWPLLPLGLGVVSFAWGWLLGRRHPEWRQQYLASTAELHAWAERNEQAKAKSAADRERRFGFDPLASPAWRPEPWTTTPHPGPALLDFIRQAYTSFPRPAELIPLPLIEVRATQSEPVSSMREALRRLGAD